MADKQIPGIALNFRILLLGQTRELGVDEQVGGLSVQEETVLEHVIRSNHVRERYLKESQSKSLSFPKILSCGCLTVPLVLSTALDGHANPSKPIKALRTVRHERLLRKLDEAHQTALRRSGARGLKARKALI